MLGRGENVAGYRQFRWLDNVRQRPVWCDVWYPAATGTVERPWNYGLGTGSVAENATLAEDREGLPVVVFSHGAGGSSRNYAWLTEYLARNGFVVLGLSHFGESPVYGPETIDWTIFAQLWVRPPDCSFALDMLFTEPIFAGHIDATRIAALGHSSGGATVVALAGAAFNPSALGTYCRSDAGASDKGCDYARGAGSAPPIAVEATKRYKDERVRAAVLLDPAAGPGYSKASLQAVAIPVMVVGAVDYDFLPFIQHAGRYASMSKPPSRLEKGEGNFVYLNVCSGQVAANGVPMCVDREGVDRTWITGMCSEGFWLSS